MCEIKVWRHTHTQNHDLWENLFETVGGATFSMEMAFYLIRNLSYTDTSQVANGRGFACTISSWLYNFGDSLRTCNVYGMYFFNFPKTQLYIFSQWMVVTKLFLGYFSSCIIWHHPASVFVLHFSWSCKVVKNVFGKMPFEVYRVIWGLEFVELNLETFTKINYFTS